MVDVVAIPDRLEDPIRQAKGENVLDGLFAQIVVDAVDLRFLEDLLDLAIELAGGGQVGSKGFSITMRAKECSLDEPFRPTPPR